MFMKERKNITGLGNLMNWKSFVFLGLVLMTGGFSNAHATNSEMVLISGADPQSVPNFYIGKYEVTLGQYLEFNPSHANFHTGNSSYPVEKVSWYNAVDYCNWLSATNGLSNYYDAATYAELGGTGYRLPTEDEYYKAAAWNGTGYNTYGFGRNTLVGQDTNYVNSGDPWDNNTTPVGYYDGINTQADGSVTHNTANQYGLYDMSGNVWEWNNDWHEGDGGNTWRVIRDASFYDSTNFLPSLERFGDSPDLEYESLGFRVASSVPEPTMLVLLGIGGLALLKQKRKSRAPRSQGPSMQT